MTRPTTALIYYKRAFDSMRRCLVEAQRESHPFSDKKMQLKSPHSGQHETVMHIEFAIRWCIEKHAPEWAASTWKITRLGYEMLFKQLVNQQKMSPAKMDEISILIASVKPLKKSERQKKTSARRKKNMTQEQFDQIQEYLIQNNNKWAKALLVWLLAGVASGLRPNEWQTASLREEDGRIILKTDNFKANEQRSYGPFREIDISELPERFITAVKEHMSVVKSMMEHKIYDKYAKGCSDLLRLCNKSLWPRRKANITLYTGRHQFSANAKAEDECGETERAAMMGHKIVLTSRERYGRLRHGSKGITPKIADQSVLSLIKTPESPRHHPSEKQVINKK